MRCTFDTVVGFRDDAGGEPRVIVNDVDATDELRTETAGAAASAIAAIPEVRAALKDRQRAFRQMPGLVADGRDMGTVIFPDAAHKVFLTASAEERADRRYKQLKDLSLIHISCKDVSPQKRPQRCGLFCVSHPHPVCDVEILSLIHI